MHIESSDGFKFEKSANGMIKPWRFDNISEYTNILQSQSATYQLTSEIVSLAKPKMIIMHPLPRNNEIPPEIDADPRAVYFKQMQYGLYMRMALLDLYL